MRHPSAINVWDLRLLLRAAAISAVSLGVVFVVTAMTDEGGVAFSLRLSRSLPAVPLASAVGAGLAFRGAVLRGEIRALEALGRTPARSGLGAVLGGSLAAAVVALALVLSPSADVTGFYPSAYRGDDLRAEGDTFVDGRHTYRIERDGALTYTPDLAATAAASPLGAAGPSVPPAGRAVAIVAVFVAGVALARLVASGRGLGPRDFAMLAAFLAASALLFHAAALRRVPAWAAPTPAVALLVWASVRSRLRALVARATKCRKATGVRQVAFRSGKAQPS